MVSTLLLAYLPPSLIISIVRSSNFGKLRSLLSTLIYICLSPARQLFFLPSIQHFHFYLLCFTTFTAMHVEWRVESTGESQSERKFHWRLWGRCVIWLNLFIYIRASSSLHHCDKKSSSFYHRNERNAVAVGCAKITRTARGGKVNGADGGGWAILRKEIWKCFGSKNKVPHPQSDIATHTRAVNLLIR